ncbi:MAG: hypothetical protein Q7K57_40185 [Burkholderiaceae bacterium]|nr:hypothetical protein [Burkholderiaceae bacterium]
MNTRPVSVKIGPLGPANIPNHPEVAALIDLLALGNDLLIAEGGENSVMVTGQVASDPSFMFTKTDNGYTFERTK